MPSVPALEASRSTAQEWGFSSLTSGQEDTLDALYADRDVVTVLPTGSGKSLCYMLPAHVRDGIVLIVAPLIALMRQQQQRLQRRGLNAVVIDSDMTREEKTAAREACESGEVNALLVSPERLSHRRFREWLHELELQLIVVDEAHCIAQWGNGFRPEYRHLGAYLKELRQRQNQVRNQSVPVLALTATATSSERSEISSSLQMQEPHTVMGPFWRENLSFAVHKVAKVDEQTQLVCESVLETDGSAIVYVPTRKMVGLVGDALRNAKGERPVMRYHGAMRAGEKQRTLERFSDEGRPSIVVATSAFGMGVDHRDVRLVVHAGLPASLTQFVQEVGRAGRDGAPAAALSVYTGRDFHIQKFLIEKTFPSGAQIQLVHQGLVDLTQGRGLCDEGWALSQLPRLTGLGSSDIGGIVEILVREDVVQKFWETGTGRAGASGRFEPRYQLEVDPEGGRAPLATLLRQLPKRRQQFLTQLDEVKEFLALDPQGYREFLTEYFR